MILELQDEKQRLDQAIEALERLSPGAQKRRGRPPKWLKSEENGKQSHDEDPRAAAPPKAKAASN